MRIVTHGTGLLDASALIGIVAGFAMLLPAFFVPELRFLALPAFVVLVPSLLFGAR